MKKAIENMKPATLAAIYADIAGSTYTKESAALFKMAHNLLVEQVGTIKAYELIAAQENPEVKYPVYEVTDYDGHLYWHKSFDTLSEAKDYVAMKTKYSDDKFQIKKVTTTIETVV